MGAERLASVAVGGLIVAEPRSLPSEPAAPAVMAVDVGGSHVKMVLNGVQERRRFVSGKRLTPDDMVQIESMLRGEVAVGGPAPEAMPIPAWSSGAIS